RIGLKIMLMYMIKATTTPGEMTSAKICLDPYHTNRPVAMATIISNTGKKIEKYQFARICAFLCSALIALNLRISWSSRAKYWITLMPEICSCRKVFRLETHSLTLWNADFMASLKI